MNWKKQIMTLMPVYLIFMAFPFVSYSQSIVYETVKDSLKTASESFSGDGTDVLLSGVDKKAAFLYNTRAFAGGSIGGSYIKYESIPRKFAVESTGGYIVGISFEYQRPLGSDRRLKLALGAEFGFEDESYRLSYYYIESVKSDYSLSYLSTMPYVRLCTGRLSAIAGYDCKFLTGYRKHRDISDLLHYFSKDIFENYNPGIVFGLACKVSVLELRIEFSFPLKGSEIDIDMLSYYSRTPYSIVSDRSDVYIYQARLKLCIDIFGNS